MFGQVAVPVALFVVVLGYGGLEGLAKGLDGFPVTAGLLECFG